MHEQQEKGKATQTKNHTRKYSRTTISCLRCGPEIRLCPGTDGKHCFFKFHTDPVFSDQWK